MLWLVTMLDTDTGTVGTVAIEAPSADAACGIAEARLSDQAGLDILESAYGAPRFELVGVVLA